MKASDAIIQGFCSASLLCAENHPTILGWTVIGIVVCMIALSIVYLPYLLWVILKYVYVLARFIVYLVNQIWTFVHFSLQILNVLVKCVWINRRYPPRVR